jgi:predicted DNA-binding WGR domain protein
MQRFELNEGSSNKFWEIDADGCDVTVRFGRIGTNGQAQTKTFADAAAAKKEHDRLVKEKTGKGYVATGIASATETATPTATATATAVGAKLATVKPSPPARTSGSPPPGPVTTLPVAPPSLPTSPTATAIEWPQGGFQWSDEWRRKLPIVRGVRAPPLPDGRALLANLMVLEDDRYGSHAKQMAEIALCFGRSWTAWGEADSKQMITRERLTQPDHEYWLELSAQALVGSRKHGDPQGTFGDTLHSHALRWVVDLGVALHGLPFMIELALDIDRTLAANPQHHHRSHAALELLRRAIAASEARDHDAAIALLETQAGGAAHDRLMRAYMCPHRSDWVLASLADTAADAIHLLRSCVMPAPQALAYLKLMQPYMYYLEEPLLLQIHLHGDDAFELLAHALRKAQDKSNLERALEMVQCMHLPSTVSLLAERIEDKEVRAALEKLASRYPAAVLKTVIEQALTTRSRLAEGWAVRMALREPAALAAVMPALEEGLRARFAGLLADLQRADAAPELLPPLLREPPWLRKQRASELPTLTVEPVSTPERVEWTAQERAQHADYKVHWASARSDAEVLDDMQITPAGQARLTGGEPLHVDDVTVSEKYFYGARPELALRFPDAMGLALWNSYPAKHWYAWGDHNAPVRAIIARWGEAAIPGLLPYVQSRIEEGLSIALVVDTPRLVAVALHALRNLKKAKPAAVAWLRAHSVTAVTAALPMAFGKSSVERDDGQFGVRWLCANGFEPQARDAAAAYGADMSQALQALLDADPLLVLPSRMPRLPAFFVAASFRRPELRVGGAALPVAAVEHIGSMLAISKLEAPYAGLAIVREACTGESLAEFAWDLFEAWSAAGNPSKDNWAFAALGLLGNDGTARRLAPKIREWPGEGGHQRAVTGLDLLAAIGSDVALMHLNGMASKLKFKALQDRAKEKIAVVAEARGFTAAELADRLVPDLGLDEQGTLELDFGPRRFFVGFDETLKPFVKDAQGARLKDLPKPIKSDDATLSEAATERYKQIKKDAKAVASMQVTRLELAMIDRRRWRAADFELFFLQHPLMRHLAARLMWGVYEADGAWRGAFRIAEDWTLADAQDSSFTLPDDTSVGIAHVLEVPKPMQDAFGQVFADYEILQPFKQLGRETYALADAERQAETITRYAAKTVATGSVMGLVNRGWERGQAQDAGWIGWFSKAVGDGLQVDLQLDPGTVVGDMSYEPKQTFPALTLRKTGSWDQSGQVAFERLHPIVVSEVLRDVELLAPFKDV